MAEFNPNAKSFFDSFSSAVAQDLMTLQLTAGQPEPTDGISTVSDPIVPDTIVRERLGHFDPEIYDLRDESHLMKLLKVLLGGSGVGGLRKQILVSRLQNSFRGMHFLDLDRFYGALFGIRRSPGETYRDLDFDPYTGAGSPDDWDDIHARDASYRDRLVKFAKTIPMGGTYAGLRAMAEAMTSVECEVYESWADVDDYLAMLVKPNVLIYTYKYLQNAYPSWGAMEGHTWGAWAGTSVPLQGRTETNTRSDFVIRPKRTLTLSEAYEVQRVINVFKPAGTQFTVDADGLAIHNPASIRTVAASSEHWEVVQKVTVNAEFAATGLSDSSLPYITTDATLNQPRPAFSNYSGEEWFYNDDVMYVMATAINEDGTEVAANQETVVFDDGVRQVFKASDSVLPGAQANAGRIVSDGVLAAGPYATSRATVKGTV